MQFIESNNRLNGIVSALSQEDRILFIGPGIFLWSGLSSWTNLIVESAEFIEEQRESNNLALKELENRDLFQAASYGLDKLTKSQISEFFKKACRYGLATPNHVHQQII